MTSLVPFFCSQCGAANDDLATNCFACGQLLHTPPSQKQPPVLLKGRYHAINQLGQGGMGSVYKDGSICIYKTNKATPDNSYTTYNVHNAAVQAVAWSPDGKLLASASDDSTVRILDPTTGTINLIYKGHTRPVKTVAWSPDGTKLASAGEDETVQLWDLTGKKVFTHLDYYATIHSVAWSPDGTCIAAGDSHKFVHVWIAR